MRFVSIDIETTGLDPDRCEILEVGAVINDPGVWIEKLPTFRFRILREVYTGESYALSMHRDLFKDLAISERNCRNPQTGGELMAKDWYGHEDAFQHKFAEWLQSWGIDPLNFTVAGKNFANFDAPFLKKIKGAIQWHHGILDPGSMYVRPDDEVIPNTNLCCTRAGLYPEDIPGDEHTSIHDALVVIALIRNHWVN